MITNIVLHGYFWCVPQIQFQKRIKGFFYGNKIGLIGNSIFYPVVNNFREIFLENSNFQNDLTEFVQEKVSPAKLLHAGLGICNIHLTWEIACSRTKLLNEILPDFEDQFGIDELLVFNERQSLEKIQRALQFCSLRIKNEHSISIRFVPQKKKNFYSLTFILSKCNAYTTNAVKHFKTLYPNKSGMITIERDDLINKIDCAFKKLFTSNKDLEESFKIVIHKETSFASNKKTPKNTSIRAFIRRSVIGISKSKQETTQSFASNQEVREFFQKLIHFLRSNIVIKDDKNQVICNLTEKDSAFELTLTIDLRTDTWEEGKPHPINSISKCIAEVLNAQILNSLAEVKKSVLTQLHTMDNSTKNSSNISFDDNFETFFDMNVVEPYPQQQQQQQLAAPSCGQQLAAPSQQQPSIYMSAPLQQPPTQPFPQQYPQQQQQQQQPAFQQQAFPYQQPQPASFPPIPQQALLPPPTPRQQQQQQQRPPRQRRAKPAAATRTEQSNVLLNQAENLTDSDWVDSEEEEEEDGDSLDELMSCYGGASEINDAKTKRLEKIVAENKKTIEQKNKELEQIKNQQMISSHGYHTSNIELSKSFIEDNIAGIDNVETRLYNLKTAFTNLCKLADKILVAMKAVTTNEHQVECAVCPMHCPKFVNKSSYIPFCGRPIGENLRRKVLRDGQPKPIKQRQQQRRKQRRVHPYTANMD